MREAFDCVNDVSDIKNLSGGGRSAVSGTRMTNILFMVDLLWAISGTENHLFYLAKKLNKNKFNCVIVTFDLKEMLVKKIRAEGISVYHLPLDRIYFPVAFLRAWRLRKIIKKHRIDIVQTFHFKSDTYGVLVARMSGVKRIISSRRDTGELKTTRQIILNRLVNKFVTRFIAVCNAVGDRLNKVEGIPRNKMVTLYNGVDLERFNYHNEIRLRQKKEELAISPDSFIVGITAAFRPEKAYHIFFEGLEKAIPFISNLTVLILGDGLLKGHFEQYCKNKEALSSCVKFIGHVEDVENYIALVDVFCLVPNKNEGFSNAVLEAMAMGKPVIATNVGGNAEAVVHDETGFIIPPDDPDSLAGSILKLYRDSEKRLTMGVKARKRIEEKFSIESMVMNHEALYEEIISKTP